MKKHICGLIAVVFILGCGSGTKETGFQGVAEKTDYLAQGMEYLEESDVPNAIRSFDLAIKQNPAKVENYLTLSQVYLRLRQPVKAIDTLSAATKVAPNNGEVFYLLATSSAIDGRMEEALDAAKHSAELFMAQKNQEMLKRSLALVASLSESSGIPVSESN